MLNSISVDVEEYFHAANLAEVAPPKRWYQLPSRVEVFTNVLLEVFADLNIHATFFVLGYVARRHSALVKAIAQAGHEIASHGYGHQIVYAQTPRQFFRDIYRSKRLLEDLSATSIRGYRAPNFSITSRSPWAHDLLLHAGYRYDSSLYPTWHPRYSNLGLPRSSFILRRPAGELKIAPLAVGVGQLFGRKIPLPVAGGAYWRLLPHAYISYGLRSITQNDRRAFHCYVHPWEFDPGQPRFDELSPLTRFRHMGRAGSFRWRFKELLKEFSFGTITEVLNAESALLTSQDSLFPEEALR